MLIGITGSTASGKTTFAEKLVEEIDPEDCLIIHQDSYYLDRSHFTEKEIEKVNFDHPDSIDFSLLQKHLEMLKKGLPVKIPHYTYATHKRSETDREILPKDIMVLEGILVLHDPGIREMLDLKIFVYAEEEVRLSRRIQRDVRERGRIADEVLAQYFETVKPMDRKFVIPSMRYADLIIPFNEENTTSVKVIASFARKRSSLKGNRLLDQ
jgi:uridine kinase